jgi:hypothetical protein
MKAIILAAAFAMASGAAMADTCKAGASAKKLSGAAMNSYMKKCETDAKTTCDKQAASKKLSGAAKTSFAKKCLSDAVGA